LIRNSDGSWSAVVPVYEGATYTLIFNLSEEEACQLDSSKVKNYYQDV
jgi:hypothetical protein